MDSSTIHAFLLLICLHVILVHGMPITAPENQLNVSIVTSSFLQYTTALEDKLLDFGKRSGALDKVDLVRLRHIKRHICPPILSSPNLIVICINVDEGADLSLNLNFLENCREIIAKSNITVVLHGIKPGDGKRAKSKFIKTHRTISDMSDMIYAVEQPGQTDIELEDSDWRNMTEYIQAMADKLRPESNKETNGDTDSTENVAPRGDDKRGWSIFGRETASQKAPEPNIQTETHVVDITDEKGGQKEARGLWGYFQQESFIKETTGPTRPSESTSSEVTDETREPSTDIAQHSDEESDDKASWTFFGEDTSTEQSSEGTPSTKGQTEDKDSWSIFAGDTSTESTAEDIPEIEWRGEDERDWGIFGWDTSTKPTPKPTPDEIDYLAVSIIVFALAGVFFFVVIIAWATLQGLLSLALLVANKISESVRQLFGQLKSSRGDIP